MKKSSGSQLGRTLIKSRSKGKRTGKAGDISMLHTTDMQDGYEWGRLNLQSVTEQSSFQEFLDIAELARTEFEAEKLNIKLVNPKNIPEKFDKQQINKMNELNSEHKDLLMIPRRPAWNPQMSKEELYLLESTQFLDWRRALARIEEEKGMQLTPFEKNLEFWRQLWRVVEKSDVLIQIVDARNPLMYWCENLEKYVSEWPNKKNLILINKSDFLTEEQRRHWAEYFTAAGVQIAFYSAMLASEQDKQDESTDEERTELAEPDVEEMKAAVAQLEEDVQQTADVIDLLTSAVDGLFPKYGKPNSYEILTKEELIKLFRTIHDGPKVTENVTTVGFVGYPNVGKSSTINSLLGTKKVSVSATPGRTKHFQTHFFSDDVLFCDCPGLVMPNFVSSKSEMIINGILPIDQMRDHIPPVQLITSLIPRHVIEEKYSIMLSNKDPNEALSAEELLNAYGYNRGFMTVRGLPDQARASRYILKDFINGKLLYCQAPPGINQEDYHFWPEPRKNRPTNAVQPPRQVRYTKAGRVTTEDIDKEFYGLHIRGKQTTNGSTGAESLTAKPWKQINKHKNKNKREKLRRVHAHLDLH